MMIVSRLSLFLGVCVSLCVCDHSLSVRFMYWGMLLLEMGLVVVVALARERKGWVCNTVLDKSWDSRGGDIRDWMRVRCSSLAKNWRSSVLSLSLSFSRSD